MDAQEALDITFHKKKMHISLLLTENGLAPLFDGAAWAGTRLWEAAIAAIKFMSSKYAQQLGSGAKLLELGCGTGVPGMCCRILGGEVLLTEQPQLIPLLDENLQRNFSGDAHIRAEPFSWGEECAKSIRAEHGSFRFVLACDCIFAPLYGDSWRLLADSLHVLLQAEEARPEGGLEPPIGILAMQRRNGDQVDTFFEYLRSLNDQWVVNLVYENKPIEIYEVFLASND
ncbi:hypothetical protein GUITHDRAFT_109509 [Guillardia theta CCMP2712]|uniref:Uncharacterized protein n=2 Tax=Guillardia theta TaxID=55529 RepID=L1J9I4_GUITC|nr:hypothetical protein GUITHDRAFT_109509 [Guillardia theta CCMP2712]EKX44730.1 hypothetical protein GUITHDRAFT_109509 [Guillardia theta CCMP2712]|eukprot:XP_005831710.1 hypothetical protein GUITHDRAFT_109509 [Guillardia theta CCMP2712]